MKETGENNRMGKTSDLFKKIRDTKGNFHAKMGTIKDRNAMDLQKQKTLRRDGKTTEKNYTKKDLKYPDNHDGMITHLEPDILECRIKWALGSTTMNKASRGDRIPVELFQILKDDAMKALHSICPANLENTAVVTGWEKVSFHSNNKERQCQKCSNYHTIALFSHASKVMLKILQPRL